MDGNQEKLTISLDWQVRDRVDEQDRAVFSWEQDLCQADEDVLNKVGQKFVDDGLLSAFDINSREIQLSGALFTNFLLELSRQDGTLKDREPASDGVRRLQLALQALELARSIVRSQDVLGAAFVSSFSVNNCLQVLRETAEATDDVMPSWASGNGSFVGLWVPTWSVPEFRSVRLALLSKASTIAREQDRVADAKTVRNEMDWMIVSFVDTVVRDSIVDVVDSTQSSSGGGSYRVMYRGEADVFEAWMESLRKTTEPFPADGWLVARSMRQALHNSGWMRALLDDYSGREFYTLSFQLIPPMGDAPTADWQLSYEIRHRFFGWSKPLADWWRQPTRLWPVGEDILEEPDIWILPMLKSAAGVAKEIGESIRLPAPSGCTIAADDVYAFLMDSTPKLVALGFRIDAPEVLRESGSRIRVRVRVKRPKSETKRQGTAGPQWFDANRLVDFDWSVVVDDQEISRDEFIQLVSNQTPFVQVGGSWRLVPVDEILRQVEQLGGVSKQSTRVLDLSRAILMAQSSSEVPVQVDYQEEALPIEQVIQVLTRASDPPLTPVPERFQGKLRHYQHFGYSWLLHLRSIGCGACLADDMGLGKTIQVLAYLSKLQEEATTKGVHLLVCPTSLLPNWRAELARFVPSLSVYVHHGTARDLTGHVGKDADVDIIMTTYATLVRDLELLESYEFDALIVDEAQNIKNADTKQAQAIRSIRSGHRIALTGTPMENRLEELWALMDFLNPGYLGSASWFRRTLADATLRNPSGEAAAKLQVLLRPVLLRRRKSDPDIQTELPDKWEVNERAMLTHEQAALYQAMVNQLFTDIEPLQGQGMSRRGQILATLVRLKQVCDHPCLISGGTPSVRRSGKLRQLIELLRTVVDEGEGALVFTQFRDMGEILCDTIESELSVRPKFLHGGLSASVRGQMVDAYQSGADRSPILVLSLRAGGVGLNLTRANHVFHFDRWWNPAVEDQATDRAYRIGQTKDVQVHKMICAGTLEERIDDLITSKRELSQAIVGGSNEWVTEMDDNALRALFALNEQSIWEEDEA
ncbi:DEAD/DEAH box helicase [Alicyclobacillus dauci]|uniref:DEAD/DEAH box helicase n=1 Tax=Alicyclobacillus dauci TaxID=1475485 RepID=A0ABY6YYV4_9BACL|nr:DEAD/DEAH box helicase [Alicyclobacillus dauci]WAH35794.1 DEAD/DEAH box helicase [Alicyclobacillus dauci]